MIHGQEKKLILPKRFSSKKSQRGSVSAFPYGILVPSIAYDLTLGNPGIDAEVDPDNGDALIRIYGDLDVSGRQGEVWATQFGSGALSQFSASDNWIIPNTDATMEDWQARFTALTGDTAELSGNGVDTWIDLSAATCAIRLSEPGDPSETFTVDGTAEIRIGTGAVLVSAFIFMSAESAEKKKKKGQ